MRLQRGRARRRLEARNERQPGPRPQVPWAQNQRPPIVSAIRTPASAKSRIGRAIQLGLSPQEITERRRDLAEANIAAAIERTLATAPPLSDEQCERLGALLRGAD